MIDLRSRRIHVAGSTPNPDAAFMAQAARRLTDAVDGVLAGHRVLICDRDRKLTDGFRRIVQGAGVLIVLPACDPAPPTRRAGPYAPGISQRPLRC